MGLAFIYEARYDATLRASICEANFLRGRLMPDEIQSRRSMDSPNGITNDAMCLRLLIALIGEDMETFGVITPLEDELRSTLAGLPAPVLRGVIYRGGVAATGSSIAC